MRCDWVDDPVQSRIGHGEICEESMPLIGRVLAGDQQGPGAQVSVDQFQLQMGGLQPNLAHAG